MLAALLFLTVQVIIPPIHGAGSIQAEQVHVALSGTNQLVVSWITNGSLPSQPTLLVGTSSNKYTKTFVGTTAANHDRFYHHVFTTGLAPSTQYFYRCGNTSTSKEYSIFLSDRSSTKKSVNFLAYGDMGIKNSQGTFAELNKFTNLQRSIDLDFALHIGDISYADDHDLFDSNPDYLRIYNDWGREIESVSSRLPYMVAPGNHESSCHSWSDLECPTNLRNFTMYRTFFRMPRGPKEIGGGSQNMWYSFNFRNVHVAIISSETDYKGSPNYPDSHHDVIEPEAGPFGDQLAWLTQDLSAAQKDPAIDWIITAGHRPWYSSYRSTFHPDFPPGTPAKLQAAFEDVMVKHGVDLYLNGHIHGYERTYPVKYNNVSKSYVHPQGIVHITTGAAGSIEGHESAPSAAKDFSAKINHEDWGVGMVNVMNSTHLLWRFISSANSSVLDSVWIVK